MRLARTEIRSLREVLSSAHLESLSRLAQQLDRVSVCRRRQGDHGEGELPLQDSARGAHACSASPKRLAWSCPSVTQRRERADAADLKAETPRRACAMLACLHSLGPLVRVPSRRLCRLQGTTSRIVDPMSVRYTGKWRSDRPHGRRSNAKLEQVPTPCRVRVLSWVSYTTQAASCRHETTMY